MIKTYNIDENLESLDFLDLVHRKKTITEVENEINHERDYFDALEKYLNKKEAKILLNFDHLIFRKRKRTIFENQHESHILTNADRLKGLEEYFNKKQSQKQEKNKEDKRSKKIKLTLDSADIDDPQSSEISEEEDDDDDFSISTRKTQSQNTQSQKTRRAEQKISIGQIKKSQGVKKTIQTRKNKKK